MFSQFGISEIAKFIFQWKFSSCRVAAVTLAFNKQGLPQQITGSCFDRNGFDCNGSVIEYPQNRLENHQFLQE